MTTIANKVRQCAELGLTIAQAAERLSTGDAPRSRSSISSIAKRNGIKFRGNEVGAVQPARSVSHSVVSTTPKVRRSSEGPFTCMWAGCTAETASGVPMCYEHRRQSVVR